MKAPQQDIRILTFLSVAILSSISQNLYAQDYIEYFLNDLEHNQTIVSCPGEDSLRFYPPSASGMPYWLINNYHDTIYSEILTLKNGYQGLISFQSSRVVIDLHLSPLILNFTKEHTIVCGETLSLDAIASNYTGTEPLSYQWSPATGLSDPTVPDPDITAIENTEYLLEVTSAEGCIVTDHLNVIVKTLDTPEICIVGRDSANKNMVIWNRPLSASIDSFFIYKETFITDEFQKVGAVEYHALSIFVDSLSNPDVQSNRYKLSALDNCGMETELSPHHKTLHLAINQGQNDTWNLIWENYEGFPATTYLIYRGTSIGNLEMIGASPASNTQYSDINAPTGVTLYYQIEVFGPNTCNPEAVPVTRKSTSYNSSRSNIVEFELVSADKLSSVTNPFDIYPNPAKNQIHIISPNNDIIGTIGIFNIGGQLLKKVDAPGNETSINLENLAPGVYFIRISNNNEVYTQKFTKQ